MEKNKPLWHAQSTSETLNHWQVNEREGLTQEKAAEQLEHHGQNRLTAQKGQTALQLFFAQFNQPLVLILLGACVITALLQEWVDSGVIFAVVMVNAIIGFVQEGKARKAIAALAQAMSTEATVIRNGERQRIDAQELVPGDIVVLQSGDKVPADLRLVMARDLQIDESALTGESVPSQKNTVQQEDDTVLADRVNMAYSSTLVTYGSGVGVITATGDDTEVGQINALIAQADILATPLTRKIGEFSHILLYVILGLAALTFAIGAFRGQPLLDMFMAAVALAVGAIPEGLPAAMTITLAIGVARMAKRHAIIRKLPAVETLGSTTVVCSDKTGTLTCNQMTVRTLVCGQGEYQASGDGYAPEGAISMAGQKVGQNMPLGLKQILQCGALCNDSRLKQVEGQWQVEGDPTEAALLTSANKAGLSLPALQKELPRLDTIPFESEHQYMATLHQQSGQLGTLTLMKGSVEALLSRCTKALDNDGKLIPLDQDSINCQVNHMAGEGQRVLAFALREMPAGTTQLDHSDLNDMIFVGLQGMIDPPRAEAIEAVKHCQGAGLMVKMITGDHAVTALAIARQLGINGTDSNDVLKHVLTGKQLAEMDDQTLLDRVQAVAVFARVAPEQKLRLVKALQHHQHVVAMTGDGVNDAPALRQADIGVAMGIAGTDVAKEASDMILTDDNFISIKAAVEEGRGIYDNLIKFITWTLPTNVGEGLVILAAIMLGTTLPILPVQILWINMTTAVMLGLMLAFEPKEPGIMQRMPRNPKQPILTRPMVRRILLVGILMVIFAFGLFEWTLQSTGNAELAHTVAVNVFVFCELFYLFNCRSLNGSVAELGFFSNRWLLGGVAMMTVTQLAYTYLPFMQTIFRSAPMELKHWLMILACGLAINVAVAIDKRLGNASAKPGSPADPAYGK